MKNNKDTYETNITVTLTKAAMSEYASTEKNFFQKVWQLTYDT